MTKTKLKQRLYELTNELPYLASGTDYEIIYQIDELNIYGDFDCGVRGVDHNILLFDDVSWDDILTFGTLVIPESQTYISNQPILFFESLGLIQLPLNNNHIVGFK